VGTVLFAHLSRLKATVRPVVALAAEVTGHVVSEYSSPHFVLHAWYAHARHQAAHWLPEGGVKHVHVPLIGQLRIILAVPFFRKFVIPRWS
jgi:hypothetical protein